MDKYNIDDYIKSKENLEETVAEIQEQNLHGNDPGYWTSKQQLPLGTRNLYKHPVFLIFFGIISLTPLILAIIDGNLLGGFLGNIFATLFGIIIIIFLIIKIKKK